MDKKKPDMRRAHLVWCASLDVQDWGVKGIEKAQKSHPRRSLEKGFQSLARQISEKFLIVKYTLSQNNCYVCKESFENERIHQGL